MRRSNNWLGCLSVSAFRVGENLISSAKRIGKPLNLRAAKAIKGINLQAAKVGKGINFRAAKVGKGINVSCSLVCTVDKEFFLYVAPDVVWLTYDELSSADIQISSNVKWIIE